jgi:hypothetical protein
VTGTLPTDSWLCERPQVSSLVVVRVVLLLVLVLVSSWLTVMENSWCVSLLTVISTSVFKPPSIYVELFVLIRLLCLDVGEEVKEEKEEGFNLEISLILYKGLLYKYFETFLPNIKKMTLNVL